MRLPRYRLARSTSPWRSLRWAWGRSWAWRDGANLPPPGRSPPEAEQRSAVVRHVHRPPIPPLGAIRAGTRPRWRHTSAEVTTRALQAKYECAARYPWLPVEPDRPEPN